MYYAMKLECRSRLGPSYSRAPREEGGKAGEDGLAQEAERGTREQGRVWTDTRHSCLPSLLLSPSLSALSQPVRCLYFRLLSRARVSNTRSRFPLCFVLSAFLSFFFVSFYNGDTGAVAASAAPPDPSSWAEDWSAIHFRVVRDSARQKSRASPFPSFFLSIFLHRRPALLLHFATAFRPPSNTCPVTGRRETGERGERPNAGRDWEKSSERISDFAGDGDTVMGNRRGSYDPQLDRRDFE